MVGRSLDNSTEIAQDLGYLDLPQGLFRLSLQMQRYGVRKHLVLQFRGFELGGWFRLHRDTASVF